MGDRLVVVMSSYSLLKEAFVKHGIILSSGEVWKEHRKVSLEILREMGLGKNVLAEKIREEIVDYIHLIEAENGLPFNPTRMTHHSVANIICSVTFGKRYQHGDPNFSKYLEALENNMQNVGGNAAILNFLPFLRFLPGDFFCFKRITANAKMIDALCISLIDEHQKEYNENAISDFIGAYIREMKKHEAAKEPTSLNGDNLWQTIGDLFAAGMETTATTLCWALVYFLHYPEHSVSEDVVFHGYAIPKDAIILPLMETVLLDKEIWSNPDEFCPERFLTAEGTCKKPDEFIPFSLVGVLDARCRTLYHQVRNGLFQFWVIFIYCRSESLKLENGAL
nr:hypothetical protein BaRGS_002715 [Batillaria attramentaria]